MIFFVTFRVVLALLSASCVLSAFTGEYFHWSTCETVTFDDRITGSTCLNVSSGNVDLFSHTQATLRPPYSIVKSLLLLKCELFLSLLEFEPLRFAQSTTKAFSLTV